MVELLDDRNLTTLVTALANLPVRIAEDSAPQVREAINRLFESDGPHRAAESRRTAEIEHLMGARPDRRPDA